eukprot:m.192314 g.192314  ORF g.192314 m.192314 type:complete len:575 (-) comp18618_c0_seq1:93-1817(-)
MAKAKAQLKPDTTSDAGPSWMLAFSVLLVFRLVGAAISHITDCDEVFNYWEPLHYLLHGTGLQTWEYSPEYALRSYFYLMPHAIPSQLLTLAGLHDKVLAFYTTRAALGMVSAAVEAKLCASAGRATTVFGPSIAWLLLGLLAAAPGMMHASVALLPSSSAMILVTLAVASWMDKEVSTAIFCIAASAIVAWPFSAALGLPLALDTMFRQGQLILFIKASIVSLVVLAGPCIAVDSMLYGKPVVASFNIVAYNVLSESTSSELYGTEPWTFYFVNGALNLSLAFAAGLVGPVLTLLMAVVSGKTSAADAWWYLSPIAVWVAIFFPQAHKEERFLFPIYPLLCLSGAAVLVWVVEGVVGTVGRIVPSVNPLRGRATSVMLGVAFAVFAVVSTSRTMATHKAYHAPMDVYQTVATLARDSPQSSPATTMRLCVGKEWYRFSSSFFLPKDVEMAFIKSGYDGLLPKPFAAVNGTSIVPTAMNNMNREEPSRYVSVETCDFVVDRDAGTEADHEPRFTHLTKDWDRVLCRPFLDAARTPALFRAFYIPKLSESQTLYVDYCLLRRRPRADDSASASHA